MTRSALLVLAILCAGLLTVGCRDTGSGGAKGTGEDSGAAARAAKEADSRDDLTTRIDDLLANAQKIEIYEINKPGRLGGEPDGGSDWPPPEPKESRFECKAGEIGTGQGCTRVDLMLNVFNDSDTKPTVDLKVTIDGQLVGSGPVGNGYQRSGRCMVGLCIGKHEVRVVSGEVSIREQFRVNHKLKYGLVQFWSLKPGESIWEHEKKGGEGINFKVQVSYPGSV